MGDKHDFDGAEFSDLSIDDPKVESYMFGDEEDEEYGLVIELVKIMRQMLFSKRIITK